MATFLEDEVDAKAAAPTVEEIRSAVENNHGRVKGEEPLVQKYLAHQIQIEKLRARKAEFIQELRAKATISVHLQPASVNRVAISNSGSRAIGPENAPVTVLEFADYYCPYCRQSEDILREVIAQYGDRVRLVYRDFPINSIHPQARRAHEAARCANEQGKSWETTLCCSRTSSP